jgi:hypothetical protein
MADTIDKDLSKKKGEGDKPSKKKDFYEQYEKNFKNAALIIAAIMFFIVLAKTDLTYTNLAANKDSMLMLSVVVALVGYYLGGAPTGLKAAAIVGIILYLVPVFFQTSPQQIINKAAGIINPNMPSAPIASNMPASGRTFTITLMRQKKYDVDKVRQGQRWSFPAFTGQFQSRVDTGDDTACWETVENTLTWKAEKSGTLQIRTEQDGIKVTANIQS